ncbi:hypothetical protein LOC68_12905 [Blastopirellula sp. JC732]|uniref:Uncharacterized protein n=1 Tax=Blastopirellula sediminis TaxID=2894196 RepID=A0A9X1MMH1_9BACT|nr:hypothetical protein [Blastopirellula sediminis]MCC9607411.1 hypothetical protein [Blastopirellula sediminis]MCC9629296.1 hypothetical protein [Blastopirellula sediminis]
MTKLRQWTTFAFAPLWRWKWLFLISFLATSYCALTAIRDEPFPGYLEQGWPKRYSTRLSEPAEPSPWLAFTCLEELDLPALVFNLSITLTLSLVIVYAWHRHCERHGSWRQFDLKELMLITLLLATGIGMTIHWRSRFLADQQYLHEISDVGWHPHLSQKKTPPWYLQPQYSCGLLGQRNWSHHHCIVWGPVAEVPDINRATKLLVERGDRLPAHVTDLILNDSNLNDDGVAALSQWAPNCRELRIDSTTSISTAGFRQIRERMHRLELLLVNGDDKLSDECIQEIGKMRSLKFLVIVDTQEKTHVESLRYLRNLSHLEYVQPPEHWEIPPSDRDEFAQRGVQFFHIGRSRSMPN